MLDINERFVQEALRRCCDSKWATIGCIVRYMVNEGHPDYVLMVMHRYADYSLRHPDADPLVRFKYVHWPYRLLQLVPLLPDVSQHGQTITYLRRKFSRSTVMIGVAPSKTNVPPRWWHRFVDPRRVPKCLMAVDGHKVTILKDYAIYREKPYTCLRKFGRTPFRQLLSVVQQCIGRPVYWAGEVPARIPWLALTLNVHMIAAVATVFLIRGLALAL